MSINYLGKGTFTSGTGDITPPFPSVYTKLDFLLLVCSSANQEISAPSGWSTIASAGAGTPGEPGGIGAYAFYRVATSDSETAPTIADSGDHQTAIIFAFRGVDTINPINVSATAADTAVSTSVSFPSVTTTKDRCTIVHISGIDDDQADTSNISAAANSNLYARGSTGTIVALHNESISTGYGGGLWAGFSYKLSAGSTGNTTATADSTNNRAYITIALNESENIVAVNRTSGDGLSEEDIVSNASTSAFTLTPSAINMVDDLLILLVSTANQSITTPSDWIEFGSSPLGIGTAGAAGAVRISAFYKIAESGDLSSGVTVPDSGNYQSAMLFGISGYDIDNIVNFETNSSDNSATNTITFPSVTTTADNCLIIFAFAGDTDISLTTASLGISVSSTNVIGSTQTFGGRYTALGNGGGIAARIGLKSEAGTTEIIASSSYSEVRTYITIAINPIPLEVVTNIANALFFGMNF